MDDIAPLRQLAASVTSPSRPRPTDSPGQVDQVGSVGSVAQPFRAARDVVRASQQNTSGVERQNTVKPTQTPSRGGAQAGPVAAPALRIKPFDGRSMFLFTPAFAYRVHYSPSGGRPDVPEYPPAGARIDYYLGAPSSDVKLEILDAAGAVVRTYTSAASGAQQGGRGGRRGGGLPAVLPARIGMNRFVWDLRYPGGPSGGGDGEGGGFGGGGPLVAPGPFRARLTAGGVTKTESFVVKIDPRVAKDGVTAVDLAEQTKFALKVRDSLAEARQLSQRVRQALEAKRGDPVRLQAVSERLNTKSGVYEDQMFIDQLSNVGREIGQADQKVPASAIERYNQLMKEWTSIKADGEAALR